VNPDELLRELWRTSAPALAELAMSKLLSSFEQPALDGSALRARYGAQALRWLRKVQPGQIVTAPKNCYRNALLGGFEALVADAECEHVLVAFGRREGAKTHIDHVFIDEGTRSSVAIPPTILDAMKKAMRGENAELLVVHNHPARWERALAAEVLGRDPLPSELDRYTAMSWLWPLAFGRMLGQSSGSVRFYLIENEKISLFEMPPFAVVLQAIEQLRSS
jgi:hypothetical protein